MDKKIYFSGNSNDFKLAEKLCDVLAKDLEPAKTVVVLGKGGGVDKALTPEAVVYEFGTIVETDDNVKRYTYSAGQSNADICGLNFQKREMSRSLELLSGSFMGRVNIPVNSEYTQQAVLYCAAGFMAAEVNMRDLLKVINDKIE